MGRKHFPRQLSRSKGTSLFRSAPAINLQLGKLDLVFLIRRQGVDYEENLHLVIRFFL